jgi:hypothetical protein
MVEKFKGRHFFEGLKGETLFAEIEGDAYEIHLLNKKTPSPPI